VIKTVHTEIDDYVRRAYYAFNAGDWLLAAHYYKNAVDLGDASSNNHLEESEKLVIDSVSEHDAEGLFWLAREYHSGLSLRQSYEKAFQYFTLALERGYSEAVFEIADYFRSGFFVEKCVEEYHSLIGPKASLGNLKGLHFMSICLIEGFGIKVDTDAAMKILGTLEDKEYPPAINSLGCCYDYGDTVNQDYSIAYDYFKRAAQMGNANGMKNYGSYLLRGISCSSDVQRACYWLNKAANRGVAEAKRILGEYLVKESDKYIEGFLWLHNAAEQGCMIDKKYLPQEFNAFLVTNEIML